MKPAYYGNSRFENVYLASRFLFIQVLAMCPRDSSCFRMHIFPLKTGFRYNHVLLKIGSTVL